MQVIIDPERETHGVWSICKVLPIAPSTYCHLLPTLTSVAIG